ncbi:MAG: M48 family metallopeptidase [Gammaproteobacteria bacterium]|nr:M48 family metallopeptidase [Gammaproteobacteria bacterium]
MTQFAANYYDGRSSERRAATVSLKVPGYLTVQELSTQSRFALGEVTVRQRLGSQPAVVELPEGGRLEISDAEAFHAAMNALGARRQWIHRLESSWPTVLLVLVFTLLVGWLTYDRGVPALAAWTADRLPVSVDQQIGRDGLELVDEYLFRPTTLNETEQAEWRAAMDRVVATVGGDYSYQLEFRDGKKIGANAFALPSGIIIFTDQLINLAEQTGEIEAIMAHEVGHVRNRHSLRTLIQNSLLTGLLAVITGDVTVGGSIAAGLPNMLATASYSREFEYEADGVAKEYLRATGQPLSVYADIMERMAEGAAEQPGFFSLLSTHPATEERLKEFRE